MATRKVWGERMMAGGVERTSGFKFYLTRPSDGLDMESGLRKGDTGDDLQCVKIFTSSSLPQP